MLFDYAHSADHIIAESSILGYHEDKCNPGLDEYITKAAIKLYSDEVGAMLPYPPRLICSGSFDDLPCVKMYVTNLVPYVFDVDESSYRRYLFNECDSSIYHFGGDTYRYHQIMKHYFDGGIDSIKICNYFNLYLNTISVDDGFYILDSTSFINSILYQYGRGDTLRYPESKEKEDICWVAENTRPPHIRTEGRYYYIRLFSWDYEYGKAEFWQFIINQEFMQIIEYRFLRDDLGPSAY